MNTTLIYIFVIIGIIVLAIIDWKLLTKTLNEYEHKQQIKEEAK
jgi:hypothetical protein